MVHRKRREIHVAELLAGNLREKKMLSEIGSRTSLDAV